MFKKQTVLSIFLYSSQLLLAQNTAIKCYFNRPVNTQIATGKNAIYLNNTFADTIAAYINRAKYTIDIAMYNYTSTANSNVYKIAVAANAAANRGVSIRWLYNGTSATSNTGLAFLNTSIKKFASANYTDYIMHNKFMVIDIHSADSTDAIVQTGSYNFSDFQTTGDYNNIVFVQSKQVAAAYYNEFNKMWGSTTATPNATNATFSTFKTASTQTQFIVNGTPIEVYFSPKDSVGLQLQRQIATADEDVFFGVYTFTDAPIANAIKGKYNAGIHVKGIMDEFSLPFAAYGILNPVLGSDMKIFTGTDIYHSKIMLIDAFTPNANPLVFTGSFNWTTQAQQSNDENAIVIHDAAIANQYYQAMCNDYTVLGGKPCVAVPCTNGIVSMLSSIRGNTYQWQQNIGTGFMNITDNSFFVGTTTINLIISNPPSNWYGYQYRCIVNSNTISDTTNLNFTAYWNGSTSSAWENPLNWNCGSIPDANTNVIIESGVKYLPTIFNTTSCRSIQLNKNTTATIMAGIQLILTGK